MKTGNVLLVPTECTSQFFSLRNITIIFHIINYRYVLLNMYTVLKYNIAQNIVRKVCYTRRRCFRASIYLIESSTTTIV